MKRKQSQLKKFWEFLKKDTWTSWFVSLILIIIIIKFIFFPTLSFVTSSPLPLVVVESCSMYHEASFDSWWEKNSAFYEKQRINKADFFSFPFKNGLNKGDIILVWGHSKYKKGDIIIFEAGAVNPIIHRAVTTDPISTKGDNGLTNPKQSSLEKNIAQKKILGKSLIRVPAIGWIKLIFFEPLRAPEQRGLCR